MDTEAETQRQEKIKGKSGTTFLRELSERGVRVRTLTNSLASTDVGVVHAG